MSDQTLTLIADDRSGQDIEHGATDGHNSELQLSILDGIRVDIRWCVDAVWLRYRYVSVEVGGVTGALEWSEVVTVDYCLHADSVDDVLGTVTKVPADDNILVSVPLIATDEKRDEYYQQIFTHFWPPAKEVKNEILANLNLLALYYLLPIKSS
jgi:hypothetical protein